MADLTALNGHLSRYVLRQLDADGGRIGPTSVADEHALVETMEVLARDLRKRDDRRAVAGTSPALEGEPMLRRKIDDRPSERR